MTTTFDVRMPGFDVPFMTGRTNHIPRIGESIIVQASDGKVVFVIENIIWEFNNKYEFGSLATILVKPPADTKVGGNIISRRKD